MSWAIWITGLPGSGKSWLARAAAEVLEAAGVRVKVLELDEIRKTLTPEPRYSEEERDLVYHALVTMARLLVEQGIPVIIDATAHRRRWRDHARAVIPRFAEVHVTCPLHLCQERERRRRGGRAPAGIYARAGRPGATVPGVDVAYEPPIAPEVTVDTSGDRHSANVAAVVALARALGAGAARPEPAVGSAEALR
ncbi:MAG: adenylyl-sulfate kinase [Candidatus Rokubacteria bacterium]|nr:adenylyl-sulfate kinase [Candidatus Rokubacteria bacterium]